MKFNYVVATSGVSTVERPGTVDGEAVTISQTRLTVEATPEDERCGTLKLSLSADQADSFPVGTELVVTVEAAPAAPAQQ